MVRSRRGNKNKGNRRRVSSDIVDDIVNESYQDEEETETEKFTRGFISSGSTLLNLALTDHPDHGYPRGNMVNLIGDSSAGKTVLALTAGAELSINPEFDDYRIILDDVEEANLFDMRALFGKALANRLEPPNENEDGEPLHSSTVEDFQDNLLRALKHEKPFVYIVDSLDALTSEVEEEKAREEFEAREAGKAVKGTYGMEKAKALKKILRLTSRQLKKTNSIIIIISQTIAEVDPMKSRFSKTTRAGGQALRFFAVQEIWLKLKQKHKKKNRVIGASTTAKVARTKVTGKVREIDMSIFYDYGVDDLGSCVDFLLENGHWKMRKQTVVASDLGIEATKEKLLRTIEEKNLIKKVRKITGKVWHSIEDSIKLDRKPRFAR